MDFAGGLFAVGFITAVAFALLTLYLFIKERMTIQQFLLWECVSVIVLISSLFPRVLEWTAGLIGITQRGIFVLAIGILGAYILIYTLGVYQRRNDQMIRRLNQEIALLRYQIEHSSLKEDEN